TNDILIWTLVTNTTANWLGIDPATGILSGTPSNADIGIIQVNVSVTDGNGGIDFRNFSLTINNVNDDPIIATPDRRTATEDVLYTVDYDVTDDDVGNVHKWILSTNASWLNIDDSTGVLSGTPANADVGSYWVNVTVDDWNDGIDRTNFTLTVINVNDPPFITTTAVTTATEDELYSVTYNATDIDPTSDILSWSVKTDAGWLNINSISGILAGTPTNDDITTFWANVSVHDGNDGSAWQNFTITVNNVNDPPTITTPDVTTATAGEMYTVDYNATDIDPTNDILTWSLETNADWLSLETGTGILSGAPIDDDVGDYLVNVTVNDGHGGTDTSTFTLTVEPGVVITNLPPEIITTDVTTANVDILYSVLYEATDDRTAPENLTWTMTTDANWLSFDNSTKVLAGTPTLGDIGEFWVGITVYDGEGGSHSTNFPITVTGPTVNTKPVLTNGAMSPASGDTDTEFTFSVHYQDADGDAPDSIKVVVDGTEKDLTLKSGDVADGNYTYTAKLSKGTHTYYFTANDGTDDATSTDGTPTSVANTETTSEIEEVDEKGAFEDWMLYLIIIIIIVIIIALLAFAMSRRKGAPLTEESFFATEEEELEAEEDLMAKEEALDDDETAKDAEEEERDEDTFECPTCGAELNADDTVCPECGEEFEDED
ncbi:MAG: putative Ig domain-containing protein, partial [Thermoplasmata archaeon]|nr:putative Ig domain-containing protein [Thermoplasmata archaeon]